MTKVTK